MFDGNGTILTKNLLLLNGCNEFPDKGFQQSVCHVYNHTVVI